MTRINVIPPRFLPTKYLIAEYHELPRCIKQKMDVGDEGSKPYHLGKGHMKWARAHTEFILYRYVCICAEMKYRGIEVNYPAYKLWDYAKIEVPQKDWRRYTPTLDDLFLNLKRIKENEAKTENSVS